MCLTLEEPGWRMSWRIRAATNILLIMRIVSVFMKMATLVIELLVRAGILHFPAVSSSFQFVA
jgi:hypothetical protein